MGFHHAGQAGLKLLTRGGQITWGQEFETSMANMRKPHLYEKYKNKLGMVVHAYNQTQEAEAGESLEPERRRMP